MGESSFHSEDGIGLVAAIVLHALLILAIAAQVLLTGGTNPIPERMTVSLATEVSLESTAPDPVQESRAAAPEAEPEEAQAVVEDRPEEASPPETTPPPRPQPDTRTPPRPEATQTPAPRPTRTPRPSQIDGDFLGGAGESTETDDGRVPANEIGPRETASLRQAINRQLKRYWDAPNGLEAELLVSVASWRLNEDGSLRGNPRCRTVQSTVTPSNRPQSALHCERAINAIRKAAPFNLPDKYYNGWKNIREWRFDRKL